MIHSVHSPGNCSINRKGSWCAYCKAIHKKAVPAPLWVCPGNKRAEAFSRRHSENTYSSPKLPTMTEFFLDFMWPEHDLKHKCFAWLSTLYQKKTSLGPNRSEFLEESNYLPLVGESLALLHPRWNRFFLFRSLSAPAMASSRVVSPFLTESQSSPCPGTVCIRLASHMLSLNQLPHCIVIDSELDFCSKSIAFPLASLQMMKTFIYIIPALHHN